MNEAGEFVEGEEDHVVGEAEVHRAAKDAAVGNLRPKTVAKFVDR